MLLAEFQGYTHKYFNMSHHRIAHIEFVGNILSKITFSWCLTPGYTRFVIFSIFLSGAHGISPPQFKGGLKIFGKISKGGPGKFPKFRGGLNLRGGLNFQGGPERFLPKSQLNILKSMINIDTSTISMQFDPDNI